MQSIVQNLKIYNSISGKKETFSSVIDDHVGMYVCGPTVYSNVHLGNLRTFTSFDIIYRYLTHLGYKVRYVRNITDVGHLENDEDQGEDRISKKARLENLEPMEVVQKYTYDFHETVRKFNLLPPSIEPTATGHILDQIKLIQKIINEGIGYIVNGSVYFDVFEYSKSNNYGILSKRNLEDLIHNTRSLDGQSDKKNPQDFALWKKAEPKHIMKWDSPWSKGFPGWHIECTAMSNKYLGDIFDIHGGGIDLKFPHHESEVLQTECHTGHSPMANYWLHSGHLTINSEKMSKPLDNFFLVRDVMADYSASVLRFYLLNGHYRSPIDFSDSNLDESVSAYRRLEGVYNRLESVTKSGDQLPEDLVKALDLCNSDFLKAMNDDFNTREALAVLFQFSKNSFFQLVK